MDNLLLWLGRLAGVAGLLLIAVAVALRLTGVYWLGAFQVGTVLLGGTAALAAGCFALLLVLTSRSAEVVALSARRIGRLGVVALLAAVLIGCSLIGIAYSNADQWLLYQAGHYLDLRDGQREQLGKALRERLAEHRARELGDYVDFLDRVQRAAADVWTPRRWSRS